MSIVSKKAGSQGYKSCLIFDIVARVKYNARVAFIFYSFSYEKARVYLSHCRPRRMSMVYAKDIGRR